ncbi:MAG: hypothetical protein NC302_03330 [Bacteroidales bacterium]|nr:hypothetical protein [Bacteroidales bacterium]MCM1415045.1 hypothetical protein [bacterium]MCM1422899.1 hypothetical protein [bacterium]
MKRRKRRFYINKKACTAVLLALALAIASVSSISTQAEESDAAPIEEQTGEGAPAEGEDGGEAESNVEPAYVRTMEGAVVLTAFAPLPDEQAQIVLEERETLEQLTARMPETLTAYADVYLTDAPAEEEDPEKGEKEPGEEEKNPEEGSQPGEEEKNPEEGGQPGEEEKDPEEGSQPGEEEKDPEEGDQPGEEEKNPEEGSQPGEEEKNPEEGSQPGEGNQDSGEGDQWHFFVASGEESADAEILEEENAGDGVEQPQPEPSTGGESEEQPQPEPSTGGESEEQPQPEPPAEGENEEQPQPEPSTEEDIDDQPTIEPIEMKIPVTWECADYEESSGQEERYEYVFSPKWDSALWFFDAAAEGALLPTITVRYAKEEVKTEVSTQEELAAAFAAGVDQITLKADIALTTTIHLPAAAKIELDGQGHSLLRGTGEDGVLFPGTMIAMAGEGYTQESFGTLTLKKITVNGKTETDSAAAPAILDRGELILKEEAVVCDNYNYGTYLEEGTEGAETIPDFGGGISVYGRLSLTEESMVTGNYADELGGGVYLAEGATLWLYADVIRGNTVSAEHGYGADLYAAAGSTIYYDPSIDMTREGFYLCEGVILIPMGEMALMANAAGATGKEIFLHVSSESGYTDEQIAAIKQGLEEKGYTVLTDRRVNVDASDLRDWYVYDHYETALWGTGTTANPPELWSNAYQGQDKRKFYPYMESRYKSSGFGYDSDGNPKKPATTIKEWLERLEEYKHSGTTNIYDLAQFEEHIYSRKEDGKTAMTFAGYGWPGHVDFLFYDPQSDGEKVVNFDVDSSKVNTHTLAGTGFLLNTKVSGGALTGYVVYYKYVSGTTPSALKLYYIDNVPVDEMHNFDRVTSASLNGLNFFDYNEMYNDNVKLVGQVAITDWADEMCIQIKATPTKIEVRQTPKRVNVTDASRVDAVLTRNISSTGGSAFGPLVAYSAHACNQASSFTFSNLSMYFTDAQEEKSDLMQAFERADFTQRDTQKYFVNLFGKSDAQYNEDVEMGQYREYLKLLQEEGVALVTDRDTPFDDYLGKANEKDSNLVEFTHEGGTDGLLSVEDLVKQIDEQLSGRTTTDIKDRVGKPTEEGGLKAPELHHSAGNIWLKSVTDGSQVRTLYGDAFADGGYAIQVMDNISYYHGDRATVSPVTYDVLKPGATAYVTVSTAGSSGEGDAAPSSMGETDDGITITPLPFTVEKDAQKWPSGTYVVRQSINNGSIRGYAYFDMIWGEQPPEPPVVPDTPIPDPPGPEEPEEPVTPSPDPEPTPTPEPDPEPDPEPAPNPSPTGDAPQEPPAEEYTAETVTVAAGEPMITAAEPEEEKKPGEPKTGDMPIPALPVSVGACTAFVMKLRLWLYELETGISEDKKNEILRAIISWAKDTNRVRVCLALAATAAVVTLFHLLKTLNDGRRRVVALFER